jgi:hypothetical protein
VQNNKSNMLKNIKLLGVLTHQTFCQEKYFIPSENGKRIFVFDKVSSSIEVVTYNRNGIPQYAHFGKVICCDEKSFTVQYDGMISPTTEVMYYNLFQIVEIKFK